MTRRRDDDRTMDLLSWQPPEVVERYEDRSVWAVSLRARIAKAVGQTLKDCGIPREQIAKHMSEILGEEISVNALNAYASESREESTISLLRLIALVRVTQDVRLLQLAAETVGHAVIDTKYVSWVRVGQLADAKLEIDRELDQARRTARKGK